MNYQLDIVALFTACLSLYYIIRAKKTYFLDSGFFIGLATVGFIVYLIAATYTDYNDAPALVFLNISIFSMMALSIGFAAYLLKSGDPRTPGAIYEIKTFLSKPPLEFLVFAGAICSWTVATLSYQPWSLNQLSSGISYYTYSAWFVGASAALVVLVILFPVRSVYRQSKTVRLKAASTSMKIISFSWAFFGVSLFIQIIAGPLLEYGQSIGFIIDGLLFVLISFALREPTILARIITSGEIVSEVVNTGTENDTIVLYNTESDRKRLVETFVKDGLATGKNIICHVTRAEVPFYRAVLKGADLPEKTQGKPRVTIQPIDTGSTNLVTSMGIANLPERQRELVDLDELGVERCLEVIESFRSSDSSKSGRVGRIWALNAEAAQAGILDILTGMDPKSRVIDLARQQDLFARLLGLRHEGVLGSRLLLEFEPTSKYEEVVQKFVREFQANVEPVAIFTSGGSPIYRQFSGQRNIRLFSFSTKTSTPVRLSDEQVLLPERDTSLLLDAVDKLLQTNDGKPVGIVFEVFTYLILSLGFEKAYGVISSLVEMSESGPTTVLVLVNYDALEPRVISGIRGLFQSQLRFDSAGLKVNRFEQEQVKPPGATEQELAETTSKRIGI